MSDLVFWLILAAILFIIYFGEYITKRIIRFKPVRRRNKRKSNVNSINSNGTELSNKTTFLKRYIKERMELMDKKSLATPVTVILLLIVFIILCNPIAIVGVGERYLR